jgi:hypothetical protein
MQVTYLNTVTSSTTPASVVNPDGRAIVIRKLVIGNPVAGNIIIHNTNNALSNDTTTVVAYLTFAAPAAATPTTAGQTIDFRAASGVGGGSVESDGLPCSLGSSIVLSAAMQVTVFWDYAEGN